MHAAEERPAAAPRVPVGKSAPSRREAIAQAADAAAREGAGAAAAAEEAPVVPPITGDRYKLADHEHNRWSVTTKPGTLPTDFDLNPDAWIYAHPRTQRYDTIVALCEDGSWWAEYLVVNGVRGFVNCRLLRSVTLPRADAKADAKVPEAYRIREGGPHEHSPWISERISDGALMNAGDRHHTFIDCLNHLTRHPALKKG